MMKNLNLAIGMALMGLTIGTNPAQARVFEIPANDTAALIQAIENANATAEADQIQLAPHGLYSLRENADSGQQAGLPSITSEIEIIGNGAELRRGTNQGIYLLHIGKSGRLTLNNLTLAEGNRGALRNSGELVLDQVRVFDNSTSGSRAIITNRGVLSARNSDFSFNDVLSAGAWSSVITNFGELSLSNCQFTNNRVQTKRSEPMAAVAVLNYGKTQVQQTRVTDNVVVQPEESTRLAALVNVGNGSSPDAQLQLDNNDIGDLPELPMQMMADQLP